MAGYTVLHGRDRAPTLLAQVDTPDGRRALVSGAEPALIAVLEAEEWVGRNVTVRDNQLCAG